MLSCSVPSKSKTTVDKAIKTSETGFPATCVPADVHEAAKRTHLLSCFASFSSQCGL
jgi:hypothetical protein